MIEPKEKFILHLNVGKDVKLTFDEENVLTTIRLSINKVAELFGNQVVDKKSILAISKVALLTKSNYKTMVSVQSGRQAIHGYAIYKKIPIDREKTAENKGNEQVFEQGYFEFVVSGEKRVKKSKLNLPYSARKR